MNRALGWLRLWFSNQQALHAHNRHLERQLANARREYVDLEAVGRRELDIVVALHAEGMAKRMRMVADLDAECESWKTQVVAAQADVREERALSNAAWQRLGHVGFLADHPAMPPHLAALIRTHTARNQHNGASTHA